MNASARFLKFGEYILLHRLARGGMAEIYLALDERPAAESQLVVIKRLRSELSRDVEFVAMMMDEGRLLQRLSHPSIVRRLDFGVLQDRSYIALEHVWGESLYELATLSAEQGIPFPASSAAFIAARLAEGLHHAHTLRDERGQPSPIIHRDVTLANVVISFDGEVKLVDFGIARGSNRITETSTGVIKGTLTYLAPEQVRCKPLGPWTDTYQLGVLLYQLLLGCSPVGGVLEHEVMRQIARGELLAPEKVRPDLPPYVRQLLSKAMALEPAERFATIAEFGRALRGLIRPVQRQAQARLAALVTRLSGPRKLQQLKLIENLLRGEAPAAGAEHILGWAREQPEQPLSVAFDPQLDLDSLSGVDGLALDAARVADEDVGRPTPGGRSPQNLDEVHDTDPLPERSATLSTVHEMETALHELRRLLPGRASTSWVFEQPAAAQVTAGPAPAATLRAASPVGAADDWQDAFVTSQPDADEETVQERGRQGGAATAAGEAHVDDDRRAPRPPAPGGLGTTMEQLRVVLEQHMANLPPQVAARPATTGQIAAASPPALEAQGPARSASAALLELSLPPPGVDVGDRRDDEKTLEENSDVAPTRPMPPLPAAPLPRPRTPTPHTLPGSWLIAALLLAMGIGATLTYLLLAR